MSEPEQLPVDAARAGDPAAWDALFKRYQMPLYAYIRELVRDEQTSLDLVQETFINAVRHIGGLRQDRRFGAWLFSIAHQKCIQHWRRGKRWNADALDEHPDLAVEPEFSPDEVLVRREQEELFFATLERLPLPQRSALVLHFLEDFSLEEIAEITGVPLGTVKSRLHHAKRALRQLLEETT